MVLGCIRSAPKKEHAKYLMERKKLLLQPPTKTTREDVIFADLRRAVPKPHARERRTTEWISEETWRLVDERVSARRLTRVQAKIWRLSRAIAASLKGDRKRRVEIAGEEVETLLGEYSPNPKEAWRRLKEWYKAAVNRAPPPARATLERITAERVNLYSYVPSLGENIPVSVKPVEVDDSVPTEDKIEEAVKKLRRNRFGGAVGDASRAPEKLARGVQKGKAGGRERGGVMEGEEVGPHWKNLVEIIQTAFWEGALAEEATWKAVVMIPKGRQEYQGIGLVEVMWTVVAAILYLRLTASITFHDFLHGFRAGRGTGTAILEA